MTAASLWLLGRAALGGILLAFGLQVALRDTERLVRRAARRRS